MYIPQFGFLLEVSRKALGKLLASIHALPDTGIQELTINLD